MYNVEYSMYIYIKNPPPPVRPRTKVKTVLAYYSRGVYLVGGDGGGVQVHPHHPPELVGH